MTHAAPNPGGFDPFFRQRVEEKIAESRRGAGEPEPGGPDDTPDRDADTLPAPAGPFSLEELREHENTRRSADADAADEALRQVAADLGQLLELARDQVRETGKGASRQRVRAAAPKFNAAVQQPFEEAAEFLNVPRECVADVRRLLARDGGVTPADRHQALKDIDWLRARVHEAAVTLDHAALAKVLPFVSRLAVLQVTGGPVVKDVAQAGFAALAAYALREAAEFSRAATESADSVESIVDRSADDVPDGAWGKVVVEVRSRAAEVAALLRQP